MKSEYYICKNLKEVDKLVECCKLTKYASYDWETNGKPIYNNDFHTTILSICYEPGMSVIIPTQHFETESYTDKGYDFKKALQKVVEGIMFDPHITKMGWNIKFDNQVWLRTMGIHPKGTLLDGMLAKYLLDEEKPNDLKSMVTRFLPDFSEYQKENGLDKLDWDKKPLIPLSKYAGLDTDCTFRLTIFFEKMLIDKGLYSLYRNMYMPASRVLTEVEARGLYLDRKFNQELLSSYKPKIDQARDVIYNLPKVKRLQAKIVDQRVDEYLLTIQDEIKKLDRNDPKDARKIASREEKIARIRAGEYTTKKEQELLRPLNINSVKDLPELLYSEDGFNLPILEYTDKGAPSTSEEVLTKLRLSIKKPESSKAILLDRLLELRGLEKMYKTYILGWSEKVQDDDCLHGRFQLQGTTSGRLSSAEPNMQQVPKTSVDPNIKKQLIAKPGKLYLQMDFSQAELRIMAHLSGDDTYLKAFAEDKDPHLAIAAQKYGVDYDKAHEIYSDENNPEYKVWKTRRKQAKQIAFGLIYGIEKFLLAQKLSDPKEGLIVTPDEAQEMKDEFFEEHPKIKSFMDSQEKLLIKQGYIASLFGNKRRLPQIYSEDSAEAAYAVRLGVNFPCQNAASHMTLFGAILNYWDMKQGRFPKMDLVCLVHDATYFNTKPEYINLWTIWKFWKTFKNPKTYRYFSFSIDDVDMSMDFSIGRSMAEELPFIPGYDYSQLLRSDFDPDKYMELYHSSPHPAIKDYPKLFPEQFKNAKETSLK